MWSTIMREAPRDGARRRDPAACASRPGLAPQAPGVAPLPTPRHAQRRQSDAASKTARGQFHRGVPAQFFEKVMVRSSQGSAPTARVRWKPAVTPSPLASYCLGMDGYPEHLAPHGEGFDREPFDSWWRRVAPSFSRLPRNVARTWVHRHWGHSEHGHIASARAHFELRRWPAAEVLQIRMMGTPPERMSAMGRHLIAFNSERPGGYALASIMLRRGTWPAPPIVLDHRKPISPTSDFAWIARPWGLIEGHRRLELANYLAEIGQLSSHHLVWIVTITPQ